MVESFQKQRKGLWDSTKSLVETHARTQIVIWPETHYVFIEKVGPFQNTGRKLGTKCIRLSKNFRKQQDHGYMSLYKVAPKIYRAGISVAANQKFT